MTEMKKSENQRVSFAFLPKKKYNRIMACKL